MRIPTVHLNGTDRKSLLEQNHQAARAVADAMEALGAAAPNARDYYIQGAGAFGEVAKEHRARVRKLTDVLSELNEIVEYLIDLEEPCRSRAS